VDIHANVNERYEEPSCEAFQFAATADRINTREDHIDIAKLGSDFSPICPTFDGLCGGIHGLNDAFCDIYFGSTEPDVFHGGTNEPVEVRVIDEIGIDDQEIAQPDMGQLLRDVGAAAPQTNESGSGTAQHDL
jgi:hypothetical protein